MLYVYGYEGTLIRHKAPGGCSCFGFGPYVDFFGFGGHTQPRSGSFLPLGSGTTRLLPDSGAPVRGQHPTGGALVVPAPGQAFSSPALRIRDVGQGDRSTARCVGWDFARYNVFLILTVF